MKHLVPSTFSTAGKEGKRNMIVCDREGRQFMAYPKDLKWLVPGSGYVHQDLEVSQVKGLIGSLSTFSPFLCYPPNPYFHSSRVHFHLRPVPSRLENQACLLRPSVCSPGSRSRRAPR